MRLGNGAQPFWRHSVDKVSIVEFRPPIDIREDSANGKVGGIIVEAGVSAAPAPGSWRESGSGDR